LTLTLHLDGAVAGADRGHRPAGRDGRSCRQDHAACRKPLESDEGPLITTAMVIAEAAYLIDGQLGAKAEAGLYA
jgi:hypothetical protein